MALRCLLVTHDSEVVRVVRRVLPELHIQLFLCPDLEEAAEMLRRSKLDALIVDCDDTPNTALLQTLRQGQSNRSSIVFALVKAGSSSRTAFDLGANFVLEKPLTVDRTMRNLRAAHGLIAREARRYLRCDVSFPVNLDFGDNMPHQSELLNLSEGGAALRASRRLQVGTLLKVSFAIPESRTTIEAKAEVAWSDVDGRAGLRFVILSAAAREALVTFLAHAGDRAGSRTAHARPSPATSWLTPSFATRK